jgi:tetratricopeptide (TPR) repeat protein
MPKPSYFKFSIFFLAMLLINIAAFSQPRRITKKQSPTSFNQASFEKLAIQANKAREAGKLEEAITLYQQAISLNPKWNEGWWYLATLQYEKDNYVEAAKAFNNSAALNPKVGAPPIMLGLCQFRLGDYDNALANIQIGGKLGIGDNKELYRVMRFHEGMLLGLKSEFERAQKIFEALSYDNVNNEQLFIALGLAILRIPAIPAQIGLTHKDRAMIRQAGYAAHLVAQINMSDGRREYERLATDFAKAPGVQYAYGRFLLYKQHDDDGALAAFHGELENSPDHALVRLHIAYIKLSNKDPENGIKLAEEAVKLNPRFVLGHYILGRLNLDLGETDKAIKELEISQKMAPEESKIYFSLARAYAKAGRKADAEKARATFVRLNAVEEAAAAQGQVQASPIEEADPAKPNPPKQ